MFLKNRRNGDMVKVSDMTSLTNLYRDTVKGRYQAGEEEQDPETFCKDDLVFLSGEALPRCWTDPNYRKRD